MTDIIDDRSPLIVYNTNHWDLEEDLRDFDRTSTFCKTVGGTATFNFTGPATISVFGIIQPASFQASGRSSYTIDGGTPKIYIPSADHEIHLFDIQFFSTHVFDAGPHTLVITTLDDNNHFVYLDYIQIIPKVDTSSSVALSSVIIVNPFFTGLPTFTAIEATTTTTILPIGGPGSTSGTADTAAISASNFSGTFSTTSADTSITPTGTSTKAPTEEPTEAPTAMATTIAINGYTSYSSSPSMSFLSVTGTTASAPEGAASATLHGHHVSLSAIIGPIIGLLILLLLIGFLLCCVCYPRGKRSQVLFLRSNDEQALSWTGEPEDGLLPIGVAS